MVSGGFQALWGVLMANPIILIVALIAGLVAGFLYLWNTNEAFRQFWIGLWNTIKTTASNAVNGIKNFVTTGFNAIKSTVTNIMNTVKSTVSNVWNAIKSTVSSVINGIKSTISSGMNNALSTVTTILGNIREKFRSILEGAKNIVHSMIEAIKAKFNFTWSLPHLKLPHISISGGFSLNPPSVPHFSIDWYRKAMNNPLTGTAKGAGEAGDEVMIGKNTMLGMIQEAVSTETGKAFEAVNRILERIYRLLSEYFPELTTRQLILDTGAMVGELAPKMDTEFGKIIKHKGRGN